MRTLLRSSCLCGLLLTVACGGTVPAPEAGDTGTSSGRDASATSTTSDAGPGSGFDAATTYGPDAGGGCLPSCGGKLCGDDGCAGTCGTCGAGTHCQAGACVTGTCTPSCGTRSCGDDGCGGSCGACGAGTHCLAGACIASCAPSCGARVCGDDGCGGSCGACGAGTHCQAGACIASCAPSCGTRLCGDDGCGGSCGTCGTGTICNAGTCAAYCSASCGNKACGDDGCGGSCGSCNAGQSCQAGSCVSSCAPSCGSRTCGSDGCGGSCGPCPANATCNAQGNSCDCNAGFFPSSDLSGCIATSQACPAGTLPSFCVGGRYWGVCDAIRGLQVMDCGAGNCQGWPDGTGQGSCTCGYTGSTFESLGTTGSCQQLWATAQPYENQMGCLYNRTVLNNCIALTGLSSGRCWTLVSSFGYQSSCMCDTCSMYDPHAHACYPACSSWTPSCSLMPNNGYTCN